MILETTLHRPSGCGRDPHEHIQQSRAEYSQRQDDFQFLITHTRKKKERMQPVVNQQTRLREAPRTSPVYGLLCKALKIYQVK